MPRLIPLTQIPYAARSAEREARQRYHSRAAAFEAAEIEIVVAPGCHSRPYFDPPVIGWMLTRSAAEAYVAQVTRMPDGSVHRRASIA